MSLACCQAGAGSSTGYFEDQDRSQGKVEPLRDRGLVFHLTTEEAKTALDVVTGMFLFVILLILFMLCLYIDALIGTFLVNSLHALVLFDSGASRSFVSQSFCREFDMTIGELECLLRVSIQVYAYAVY